MLRTLLFGTWMCAVTAGAALTAPIWLDPPAREQQEFIDGLDYIKTRAINVPIIADGEIEGYVIARFVFTGDARTLNALTVPPTIFVVDEAFQVIYSDTSIDFANLDRSDLPSMLEEVRERVNERLKSDVIQEVMIDRFDYYSVEDMEGLSAE